MATTVEGGIPASKSAKIAVASVVAAAAVLGLLFLVAGPRKPARPGVTTPEDHGAAGGERGGDMEGAPLPSPGARGDTVSGPEGGDVAGGESERGPEDPQVPAPQRRVVLGGAVVDRQGKAEAGAHVVLTEEFTVSMGLEFDLSEAFKRAAVPEDPVAQTRCNDKGEFAFHAGDAPEGMYCIRVSAPGFATSLVRDVRWDEATEPALLRVELSPPASLAGKVTDTRETPLAKAIVVAVEEPDFAGFMREPGGKFYVKKFWTCTKADGSFRIADLTPGQYILIAHKEGFAMATRFGVVAPSDKELQVELKSGFLVEGLVLDAATGNPVPGARIVALSRRMTGGMGQAESDTQGRYRFENLAPGYYQLVISARGYVQTKELVEAGAGQRVEQDFRLLRKIIIAGKVLDAGTREPVAGVRILSVGAEERMFAQSGMARTVSGPDGGFKVKEATVRADRRREKDEPESFITWLIADAEGWVQRRPMTLRVAPGATRVESVEILMERTPRASGRVVDASGRPVAGAVITVEPTVYSDYFEYTFTLKSLLGEDTGKRPRKSVSDRDGKFSIELTLHPQVFLHVHHPGYAFGFHECKGMTPGQEVEDLEVRLTPGGRLDGVVLDGSGTPVKGERVVFGYCPDIKYEYRSGTSCSEVRSFWGAVMREIRTDDLGAFTLRHLRPGRWWLSIRSKNVAGMHKRVVVSEGATTRVRIETKAPLVVAGFVVDCSGTPIARAYVRVRFEKDRTEDGSWTDREGRFRFEDVPEGMHEVLFRSEGFVPVTLKMAAGGPEMRIVLTRR